MAHTNKMTSSDKCATQGFAAIRKDFFDSLTGSYVDVTFKVMGVVTLLMAALVAPLLIKHYLSGGLQAVYSDLLYIGPTFVAVYAIGYYWVYKNVYTPVHEISTRLLAEQKSIDAHPGDEANNKDVLQWQYLEIEKLIEATVELQEQADRIQDGDLQVEKMQEEIEHGQSFREAASATESAEHDGKMFDVFNGMTTKLRKLAYQARLIADRNLDADELDVKFDGDLGRSFQEMIGNLREFTMEVVDEIKRVRSVVSNVDDAAQELNNIGHELSSGAQESSSSLEETSSSVEEMTAMVQDITENAKKCKDLSDSAVETAQDGQRQIEQMAETMDQINDNSEDVADAIEVINDIAFQTNLLAINAAVEAANAGQEGEGFAVVAEEVRELAQRSAEAADEIEETIEDSLDQIDEGVDRAEKSREVLEEINESVVEVRERVQEVDAAQDEQQTGIEEINRAVTELESVTSQNTENANSMSSASDELANQSSSLEESLGRLTQVVRQFDIGREAIDKATSTKQSQSVTVQNEQSNGSTPASDEPADPEDEIPFLDDDNPEF